MKIRKNIKLVFKPARDISHYILIQRVELVQDPFVDPRGRPTVTPGSDHYFARVVCTIRPSPLFKISQNKKQSSSENSDRYWRIIDDTHVF